MGLSVKDIFEKNTLTPPKYLPGDIVKVSNGQLGVIIKAETVINGGTVQWNDKWPDPEKIEYMHPPSYSIENLTRKSLPYNAWWHENDLTLVERGPAHKYVWNKNKKG